MLVKDLTDRLLKTSWLPRTANHYLTNPDGNEAALNLAWVLLGRPVSFPAINEPKVIAVWQMAQRISQVPVAEGIVADYLVLYTPDQFIKLVEQHPKIFTQFMPIEVWKKTFKAKT